MLGLDADQIRVTLRGTRANHRGVASAYLPHERDQPPATGREELEALRKDAENLRARIASATRGARSTSKMSRPHSYPQTGVDARHADTRPATTSPSCCAPSTARSSKAETRPATTHARPNARVLDQLLVIWCDIGGKPSGSGGGALPHSCVKASRRRREHQDGLAMAGSPERERQQAHRRRFQHRRAASTDSPGLSASHRRDHDKQARIFLSWVSRGR